MPSQRHRDPALVQVLSLYLLLLAFFALLYNISRTEGARSRAVSDSVSSTFSHEGASGQVADRLISADGDILLRAELERILGPLVKTAIPVAAVEVARSRGLLQVRFPAEELFGFENDSILARQRPLLVGIAQIVATPPPGVRYDVEALIGRSSGGADGEENGPALAIARAGRLGEALVASGAPRGTVAAGMVPGDATTVRLLFHVRSRKEARLRLDPAVQEGAR